MQFTVNILDRSIDTEAARRTLRCALVARGMGVCDLARLIDSTYRTARSVLTDPLRSIASVRKFELAIGAPILTDPKIWEKHQTIAKLIGHDPLLVTMRELTEWLRVRKVPIGRKPTKERLLNIVLKKAHEKHYEDSTL